MWQQEGRPFPQKRTIRGYYLVSYFLEPFIDSLVEEDGSYDDLEWRTVYVVRGCCCITNSIGQQAPYSSFYLCVSPIYKLKSEVMNVGLTGHEVDNFARICIDLLFLFIAILFILNFLLACNDT